MPEAGTAYGDGLASDRRQTVLIGFSQADPLWVIT